VLAVECLDVFDLERVYVHVLETEQHHGVLEKS
jgi:hypothetical protein